MSQALALAKNGQGKSRPNPSVGAIIVKDNKVVGKGSHEIAGKDHAEVIAIKEAGLLTKDADLYVTLEPCHMCAKAIVDARIDNVYFAAFEPKTGSIVSVDNFFDKKFLNHRVNYASGIMQDESSSLLKDFFRVRR